MTTIISPPARVRRPDPGHLAAAFTAGYAVLALVWTITGRGYPFGDHDPDEPNAPLAHVPVAVGSALFAGVLLTAALLTLATAGPHGVRPPRGARRVLLTVGWLLSAALVLGVPTPTLLAVVGYAPMLLLGAPFGWPPGIDWARIFDWSLLNQALSLIGGLLIARAMLVWRRRTRGDCLACGRPDDPSAVGPDPARIGRWAVAVALVPPSAYALTRFAWVFDVPLLISPDHLRLLRAEGGQWVGAGLGTFAMVGAVLTLGLVQRWGEVFPRWIPRWRGRPVPVGLAVVPAGVVAVLVTSGTLSSLLNPEVWRTVGLEALPLAPMPLWGVALGVAAAAYRIRRRGACPDCADRA